MMAFFLLLWLLNVTTESNKQGISNYFEPDTSEEEKLAGSGQALAGLAEVAEGAFEIRRLTATRYRCVGNRRQQNRRR